MSFVAKSGHYRLLARLVCSAILCFCGILHAQQVVQLKSNTTENLRGVSVVSRQVAWASGAHGTYLRTLDGGNTWTPAHVPDAATLDFRDVEAFSADVAYLLSAGPGEASRIYKTQNGGKTWTLQFTNHHSQGFFDCMAFWDRNHGIALGDPVDGEFELIVTEDGGNHWHPVSPTRLPPAVEGEGAFAASGTCITVQGRKNVWFATGGTVARVFRSSDRGQTWTVAETPIVHGAASSGIFSIAFSGPKHGVIGGGDYKNPAQGGANLAFTEDGGATWKLAEISPQTYFSALAFDPEHPGHVLAVGSENAAYADNMQSKTWKMFTKLNLNAVSLGKGKAIGVGPNGTIVELIQ